MMAKLQESLQLLKQQKEQKEQKETDFECRFKFHDFNEFPDPDPVVERTKYNPSKHKEIKPATISDDDSSDESINIGPNKILVSKIPPNTDEELLKWFFEEKLECGKITSIDLSAVDKTAVIEFDDPGAVDTVQTKTPITLSGVTLNVEVYDPWPQCTVEVCGLPQTVSNEYLEFYFTRPEKSGGGTILEMDFNEEEQNAFITFESEEVARRVAEGTHTLMGKSVTVSLQDRNKTADTEMQEQPKQEERAKTIIVKKLPPKVDNILLEMTFSSPRKIGAGPIKKIDIQRKSNTALIEFCEPKAVNIVMGKVPVKISGVDVEIEVYKQRTIRVCGLEKTITKDYLELYFENANKSGGGATTSVELQKENCSAYVTFKHEKDAKRVAERAHKFNDNTVEVCLCDPLEEIEGEAGPLNSPIDENENFTCIFLRNLPTLATKDYLEMFFENTNKKGGGPVKNVDVNEDDHTAVVEFYDSGAVKTVIKKKPIEIYGVTIDIDEYRPPPRCTVKIDNLPNTVSKDLLEAYFENTEKSGGDTIDKINIDEEKNNVYVTFCTEEVARRVVQRKHTLKNSVLEVSLHRPPPAQQQISPHDDGTSERSVCSAMDSTKIIVKYLPENVDEETLELLFGNAKRQGGGPVKSVNIEKESNTSIIEFQEPEAVDIVLKKRPIKIGGTTVEIERYEPRPLCTVMVCDISQKVDKDLLEMYFENERKSGGGTVTDITHEREKGLAYVTFETEKVAARVAAKSEHIIAGKSVSVKIYTQSKQSSQQKFQKNNDQKEKTDDDEQIPLNIVRVANISSIGHTDILQYYLENTKKSGGGEILDFKVDEKDDVAFVTFQDEAAARRVSKKAHSLKGLNLDVSLYKPPKPKPCYNDRLIFEGLAETSTEEGLCNFVEAISGAISKKVIYGEKEDTAMVTFETEPDFEKLVSSCKRRTLEGRYLVVSKVTISNCVVVSNMRASTSEDTLRYYFENPKRGGDIEKLEMCSEQDYCLIFFQDYTVTDKVLKMEHTLEGQKLNTQLYIEKLGVVHGDGSQRRVRFPDPIEREDIEPNIVDFFKRSDDCKTTLVKAMEECHAKVILPETVQTIILECALSRDMQGLQKLAKDWTRTVEETFNRFLSQIIMTEHPAGVEIWDKVLTRLPDNQTEVPGKVSVFVDHNRNVITVVGYKTSVDVVSNQIKQLIRTICEEEEKIKRTVKETLNIFKKWQIRLLLTANHQAEMKSNFPDLTIRMDEDTSSIIFEGRNEDVQAAKDKTHETVASFDLRQCSSVSTDCITLFQTQEIKDIVINKLEKNNLTATWDAADSTLTVYSYEQTLPSCVEIILETLEERSLQVKKESARVLDSKQWKSMIENVHLKYRNLCIVTQSKNFERVCITGTHDIAVTVEKSIKSFISRNTIIEERLPKANKYQMRILETHYKGKLDSIEQGLHEYYVQIRYEHDNISIKGTETGINLAKQQLNDIVSSVQKKTYTLKRPGLASHIKSKKGQDSIKCVERAHHVSITEEDIHEAEFDDGWLAPRRPNVSNPNMKIHALSNIFHGREIYTAEGDMTTQNVDVIVNSVDKSLSLSGGLGKMLVDKGGDKIREECEAFIQRNGEMRPCDVFMSTAGSLAAKYIVHVASPEWRGGKHREEKRLSEAIDKALREANKKNVSSICIPALGCGNYGFPLPNATHVIVSAIENFFREIQDSSITKVFLVDIKVETVDAFTKAIRGVFQDVTFVSHDDKDQRDYLFRTNTTKFSKKLHTESKTSYHRSGIKESRVGAEQVLVEIVKGEIAKQQVDVIVNNLGKTMNLRYGAASSSILKQGGDTIQQQLKQKYPKGLNDGEIAITTGGSMSCKSIFHGILMPWDGGSKAKPALHQMMSNCLTEATKHQYSSIAFPALGTGNLDFPVPSVAEEMFSATDKFFEENPQSSVKDIRFVVYYKDVEIIKVFESVKKAWTDNCSRKHNPRSRQKDRMTKRGGPDEAEDMDSWVKVPTAAGAGKIDIRVRQGDITEAKTDCIVNSSNRYLSFTSGAVSQALLKKCGKRLEQEVAYVVPQMQRKGLALTPAPGLHCNFILHVDADREWKEVIDGCLKLAEDENIRSLAFPALGTEKGLSAKESAKLMVTSIQDFAIRSDGTLKQIDLVIHQDAMVEEFTKVVKAVKTGKQHSKSLVDYLWTAFKGKLGFDSGAAAPDIDDDRILEDTSTVKLAFYYLSKQSAEDAFRYLEKLIDEDVTQANFKDASIRTFDQEQIDSLLSVATALQVDIDIKKSDGCITITGISGKVFDFKDNLQQMMIEFERMKAAAILKSVVQWFYIEITPTERVFQAYEERLNSLIESAYQADSPNVRFTIGGEDYILDFNNLVEFPESDEQAQMQVVRRDLIKESTTAPLRPPSTWSQMNPNEFLKVVSLFSSDAEYKTVEDLFNKTSGGKLVVEKIDRIQNITLYQQYQAKLHLLEQSNPKDTQNERTLWHGTASDAVDSINAHGFNRSYCGKNATFYGQGVYFAVESRYAGQDTYSKIDPNGKKRMYLSKVLTGEYAAGDPNMRVAPSKASGGPQAVYDSVVNDVNNPGMFIIFNDTQAYPDYLVTCKKQ